MKLKYIITATPQHGFIQRPNFREQRAVDEHESGGQIGVMVGVTVMAAIDNMRKAGEDACDPHWSILLTIRKLVEPDGMQH